MTAERRHVDQATGQVTDNPPIRPFADFLREQAQGKTHDELGEALYDLAQRVRDTGKAGTLTLIVKVETMKGDERTLVVSDEIRLKLPEYPRKPSIFYTGPTGNLQRTDPDQLSLPLREVPAAGTTDVREVRA